MLHKQYSLCHISEFSGKVRTVNDENNSPVENKVQAIVNLSPSLRVGVCVGSGGGGVCVCVKWKQLVQF